MRQLTYLDFSGRPRLRRFVIAAVLLLGILAGLWAILDRFKLEPFESHEQPASVSEHVEQSSSQPADKPTNTPASVSAACPQSPDDWKFLEVFPGDHYQRIHPTCVYDGVAQTAAWLLLERIGYSKPEAARLLDLSDIPWSPEEKIVAYTNYKGPSAMNLLIEWPAHPDFFFWQLDREGQPSNVISLRGCFKVRLEPFCVVAIDRSPGSSVSALGANKVTSHAADLPGTRSFHILQYMGNGVWHLKGQFADQTIQIEDWSQMEEDREAVARRLGAEVWDVFWLSARYALFMKPAPEDWRIFDLDAAAVQGITEELNRYTELTTGGIDE